MRVHGVLNLVTLADMTPDYMTRAEILAQGQTRRSIQAAVRSGGLIHVRRDRYLPEGSEDIFVRALRVGGRLTCLSLLALFGVFVLENRRLHVHINPRDGRLRSPSNRKERLDPGSRSGPVIHWTQPLEHPGLSCAVGILDALVHAVCCQTPRAAVATLDSALHLGLITHLQLREVFAALPARFRVLETLVDGRAESGPESLVRLMAGVLGCDIRLQVSFDGIGRVDLLLDGWLVVECDSKEFHASWQQQVRDRERDLALAALGYSTLRLTAAKIMYRPDEVLAALRGLVLSRRPV